MIKISRKKIVDLSCGDCSDGDQVDFNKEIPFSCATEIPSNFDTSNINSNNLRVIFTTEKLVCCESTTNLSCSLPGDSSIDIPVDVIKISGCIEYGVAVGPVRGDNSGPNPPRTAPICCYNTVCVDNIICPKDDNICPALVPESITLKEGSLDYEIQTVNNKKVIIFTGVFVLPECTTEEEVCGCFTTVGGNVSGAEIHVNANICPGCTINGSHLTYQDEEEDITFEYSANPPVGELISSNCETTGDITTGTIIALGEVTIDSTTYEDCQITLVLEQNPTDTPDRIVSVSIECNGDVNYNETNLPFEGQSPVEIRDCPLGNSG